MVAVGTVLHASSSPDTPAYSFLTDHDDTVAPRRGVVLFLLGVLPNALWNTLGHPIATLHVLLAVFGSRCYGRHQAFTTDRYCRRRRAALVDQFCNPKDAIVHALGPAVSRWHRWRRGGGIVCVV